MNFVQPGGVALAAVELPETTFANTDFSSAFFDVSVHKSLTADQCNEFALPQQKNPVKNAEANASPSTQTANVTETKPEPITSSAPAETQTAQATTVSAESAKPAPFVATSESAPAANQTVATNNEQPASALPSSEQAKPEPSKSEQMNVAKVSNESTPAAALAAAPQGSTVALSDMMLKDMDLRGTEAVSGEGTRQSDSKYFHVFQNGACYEFALNVTTVASEDHMTKHVDRDKVFSKLEKIMATAKIDAVNPAPATPEVAEKPVTAAPTPAQ